MNTLESCSIESPFGKVEECAKFLIDDITSYFLMARVMNAGQRHTLSFWARSESTGTLDIPNTSDIATIEITNEWQKYVITFESVDDSIEFHFQDTGTYYIYHPKLEIGNKATDWTLAPEDTDDAIKDVQAEANEANNATNERITIAESIIQQLADNISMLVKDENGESMMMQTSDGWVFSMQETNSAVSGIRDSLSELQTLTGKTADTVGLLNEAVKKNSETLEYIQFSTYNDQPCIELGESDTSFKLLITNTSIMFWNGSDFPTRINTDGLETDNIKVDGEIRQGGYVMMNTADGGWGLLWKGVSS